MRKCRNNKSSKIRRRLNKTFPEAIKAIDPKDTDSHESTNDVKAKLCKRPRDMPELDLTNMLTSLESFEKVCGDKLEDRERCIAATSQI